MFEEVEYRGKISEPSLLEKELDLFCSDSVDIESIFADECFESPLNLSTTMKIGAKERNFIMFFVKRSKAYGAESGWSNNFLSSRPSFFYRCHDFWYHLTCTDDIDRVSLTDILFLEFIIVMEGGTTNHDSSYIHYLEIRDGRDNTSSTDRMLDRDDTSPDECRRKLVCDGISRMMFGRSEEIPEREIIEFYDHTISIVRENTPFLRIDLFLYHCDECIDSCDTSMPQCTCVESETPEKFHELRICHRNRHIGFSYLHLRHTVREKKESSFTGNERIELTKRTGSSIARIREEFLSFFETLFIERDESCMWHHDLSSYFESSY